MESPVQAALLLVEVHYWQALLLEGLQPLLDGLWVVVLPPGALAAFGEALHHDSLRALKVEHQVAGAHPLLKLFGLGHRAGEAVDKEGRAEPGAVANLLFQKGDHLGRGGFPTVTLMHGSMNAACDGGPWVSCMHGVSHTVVALNPGRRLVFVEASGGRKRLRRCIDHKHSG